MTHQALVEEIARELSEDGNALALILYGSLSRHEETANSDIDLLVITQTYCLQKRHVIRHEITVEFLEMHMDFLRNFISQREVPVLFTLAYGAVLFDKIAVTEGLRQEARQILDAGPPKNPKWENERYKTKRRSDITEIYSDLLDTEDTASFNYIATLLVSSAIALLLESHSLWPTTRKKTMDLLKQHCYDGYRCIETLLNATHALPDRRGAAKGLVDHALRPYGGILTGDAVIFRVEKL